jgi:putative ABC transport system substrate-binding protein
MEAVPGISRVLVLSYLDDPIAPLQVKALQSAARSLGVTLQIHDIRTRDDLPAAFDAGAKERAEGLLTTAESMFVVHRTRITEIAAPLPIAGDLPVFDTGRRRRWPDGL